MPWREGAGTLIDLEVIVRGRLPWDCQNGFDMAAPPSMTVGQLKHEVCLNTGVLPAQMFLTTGETALSNDLEKLARYGFTSGTVVRAQLLSGSKEYDVIFIHPANTAIRPMAIELKHGDTALDLKRKIAAEAGIAQTRQKLYMIRYSRVDAEELPNTYKFSDEPTYGARRNVQLVTTGPVPPTATAAGSV